MKYDIFISYRREGGFEIAKLIQERLKADGYRVFLDYEGLRSGNFNTRLYQEIESCKDFIVILSENSLDRCVNQKDRFRIEIVHALKHEKNIIPFMLRNFSFPSEMPAGMEELLNQQGLELSQAYSDASYERLKVYLKAKSIKKKNLVYTGIVLAVMISGYLLFTNDISKISKFSNNSPINISDSISQSDTLPNKQVDTLKPKNEEKPINPDNKFVDFIETAENININMVAITGGTFQMGSPDSETERESDETQHTVTVSDFYMGTTELTVLQFEAFINATKYQTDAEKNGGSYFWTGSTWEQKAGTNWRCDAIGVQRSRGDYSHPVIHVSWNDADAYCNWLSQKTGKTYRLPTEAEWEYAARAGTITPFNMGNCLSASQANYDGDGPYSGCSKGEDRQKTLTVRSFSANAWGLFDMHGNVWEWCNDWYDAVYYSSSPRNNPPGSSTGSGRVLRGGGWSAGAGYCRVSNRYGSSPDSSSYGRGFRLVLSPA
jgi:formylglycine-generating enzyme required for sulfatase activity